MFSIKDIAVKEKNALLFLSKLYILLCVLKCTFFLYNYHIADGWSLQSIANVLLIIKWSLLYDAVCIALINLPLFFFCLIAGKLLYNKIVQVTVTTLFTFTNTFLIFLNTIDIFYYRFHLQRADADLLYVLRNPFANGSSKIFLVALAAITFFACHSVDNL